MTQTIRPIADVSNNGWSPTPLYEQINEAVPDDGTFVTTGNDPACAQFIVRLCDVQKPDDATSAAGQVVVSVRLRISGGGSLPVVVKLLEQDDVIATRNVSPGASFSTYDMVLNQTEINDIGDWGNLRVQVMVGDCSSSSSSSRPSSSSSSSAVPPGSSSSSMSSTSTGSSSSSSLSSSSGGVVNPCCPNESIPSTLYASFNAPLCSFDGQVVPLTYGVGGWRGTLSVSGCGTLSIRFNIVFNGACITHLEISNASNQRCLERQWPTSCPLTSVVFNDNFDWNRTDCPCCSMGARVVVTVTP